MAAGGARLKTPTTERRLEGIEGLRALAACSVLLRHVILFTAPAGAGYQLGWFGAHITPALTAGVTLFFVLSGFLLYRPFARVALRGAGGIDVSAYLRNRALRVLPAYWLVLAVSGFVLQSVIVQQPPGRLTEGALTDPGQLVANFLLLFQFHPSTAYTGVGVAWSVVVEICFYLVLPILGALAWRLARRASSHRGRRLAALAPPAAMLALGAITVPIIAAQPETSLAEPTWYSVATRSFPALAPHFVGGMLLAIVRVEWEDGRLSLPRGWAPATAIAGVGIAVSSDAIFDTTGVIRYFGYHGLMSLACTSLLALVVLSHARSPIVRAFEHPVSRGVGLVSYGIFLWHVPLIAWLAAHDAFGSSLVLNLALVSAATGVLAALTWRFVERPALEHKRPMTPRGGRGAVAPAVAAKTA